MKKKNTRKDNWNNEYTEDLFRAVLTLKSTLEAKDFFRDLMTKSELIEFGNRFKAAGMLKRGVHYTAIVDATGLSSRTIARVKKWLKDGTGGYQRVLLRLKR